MSEFVVKDSGKREEYQTGMVRDTQEGKARFSLMRPQGVPYDDQFLTRCAMHMTNGAKKYGLRNWEKAHTQEELDRFLDSAERHMQMYLAGMTDEDHAAAVWFNLNAAETVRWKMAQVKHHPTETIPDDGMCKKPDCPNFGGVWRDCPVEKVPNAFELVPGAGWSLSTLAQGQSTIQLNERVPYHGHQELGDIEQVHMDARSAEHQAMPPHSHVNGAIFAPDFGHLVGPDNHPAP